MRNGGVPAAGRAAMRTDGVPAVGISGRADTAA